MALGGFLFNLLLARALQKEEFAVFTYFITLALTFVPFLDSGLVGFYTVRTSRERDKVDFFFARSLLIKLGFSVVVLPSFLFVYYLLEGALNTTAIWLIVFLVFQSLLTGTDIVFIGIERNRDWALRRAVYELARISIFACLLYVFQVRQLNVLLAAATFAVGIGVFAVFWMVQRYATLNLVLIKEAVRGLDLWSELKGIFPYALFQFFFIFYYKINVILLGKCATKSELADYQVCFLTMQVMLFLAKGLTQAVAPRLAQYSHKGEEDRFSALLESSMQLVLFLAILVLVPGMVYGHDFILFVFGLKFVTSKATWNVIIWVTFILFVQNFFAGLLNFLGGEFAYSKQIGVSLVSQGVLNFFLVRHYGAVGVASGMLLAALLLSTLNYYTLRRLLGGNLFLQPKMIFAFSLLGAAVFSLIKIAPRMNFLLGAPLMVAIYLFLAYVVKIMPDVLMLNIRNVIQKIEI
jgi:O-antigen/teichoic acid export membrane protein